VLRAVFGIDPRSLVALRVGLAVFLLADLSSRAADLRTFYTDAGLLPRSLVDPFYLDVFVPLYTLGGSTAWVAALFAAAAVAALLLLVGCFTPWAAAASWILLTGLQLRNPYVIDFGDEIFRLVLFWSIFLPLGRHGSLDALRLPAEARRDRTPHLSVAAAGLLLQIVLVYFAGALLKTGADWLSEGTALYYTLSQDWMVRPAGRWLLRFPDLLELATRATLVFEVVAAPALLAPWPRLRTAAVVAFWLFHAALASMIRFGLFPWLLCAVLTAFLPAWFWDRLTRRAPQARPIVAHPRRIAVQSVAGVFLAWVLAQNAATVLRTELPWLLRRPGEWLRLDQQWNMYAPDVPRADGWFVVLGRLADGSLVDATGRAREPSWDKPRELSATHRSARWAVYQFHLRQPSWESQRLRYAAWLCERWNEHRSDGERLEQLQIHYVDETTPDAYAAPVARAFLLTTASCMLRPS
jgi:hypothetical protein